jgi:DNA-binding NtrC family response regulator
VLEHREITPVGATAPVPIDVRFVAATHRDLPRQVASGVFREDLLFRIAGITLVVPPLRERRDDIEPLARHFLGDAEISDDALASLRAHAWPGNVRELKATLERALVLARGQPIEAKHLSFGIGVATAEVPAGDERTRILHALDACAGNQSRAAKQLGISRATLVRRLDEFGITRPRK